MYIIPAKQSTGGREEGEMSELAVTIMIHHFKFSVLLRSLIIYCGHVTAIFFIACILVALQ